MPIVTLTTDFGIKGPYVGALKGAIYSQYPEATIVDISHEISPFHSVEAAYVIQNSYKSFPKGTVHIVGIDSEFHAENKHIAMQLDGHYFVCADNGIMSLLALTVHPDKIVEINIHNKVETNFPVLNEFVVVACHLARGGTLEVIGKRTDEVKILKGIQPVVHSDNKRIIGNILYIDNYGNLITNITRTLFEKVGQGRAFQIMARTATFTKIFEKYSDAINFDTERSKREEDGKKLARFNASDYIELAIYKSNPRTVGSAASLFGLRFRDTVSITFNDASS